jgi:hypothetical protein
MYQQREADITEKLLLPQYIHQSYSRDCKGNGACSKYYKHEKHSIIAIQFCSG